MSLGVLLVVQALLLTPTENRLLAEARSTRPATQTQVDSTLEVLRGAELFPSRSTLCGPACLYAALRYLGITQYSVDDIAEMAGWSPADGTSMLGLQRAARQMTLNAEVYELSETQLESVMNRCNVLAVIEDGRHYYLVLRALKGRFFLLTIPGQSAWIDAHKLTEQRWDGKALLLSQSPLDLGGGLLRGGRTLLALTGCAVIGTAILAYAWRTRREVRRQRGA
jgi:hypothetical protein